MRSIMDGKVIDPDIIDNHSENVQALFRWSKDNGSKVMISDIFQVIGGIKSDNARNKETDKNSTRSYFW